MTASPRLYTLLQGWESFRAKPYQDSGGVWTNGYGNTRNVGAWTAPVTEDQALAQLRANLGEFEALLAEHVRVPLNQNQYDALLSILFNVGPGTEAKDGIIRLKSGLPSTLLQKINAGDFSAASDEFPKWCHAAGRELPGLVKRRAAERSLFLEGTPMLPFIAAALPSLIEAAPKLIRLFGDSPQAEKNAQAAETVVAIAKQATGETSAEAAVAKIQSDPAAAQAYQDAVYARYVELSTLTEKSRAAARDFSLAYTGRPRNWPLEIVTYAILFMVASVMYITLLKPGYSENIQVLVIQAVVGLGLSAAGFWLGSSYGSQRKDEVKAPSTTE